MPGACRRFSSRFTSVEHVGRDWRQNDGADVNYCSDSARFRFGYANKRGARAAPNVAPSAAAVKKNDTREFPGLPIGTFIALPQVVLSATRDDNIYARRTDETDDTIFTLSPSLVLQSDWDRHELSVDFGADLDR